MPTIKDISEVNKILLPIIKKTLPNLIANDILDVQPMTGPAGQIYTMKPRYNPEKTISNLGNNTYSTFYQDCLELVKKLDNEYDLEIEYLSEQHTKFYLKDDIKNAMFIFYVTQHYKIVNSTFKELK